MAQRVVRIPSWIDGWKAGALVGGLGLVVRLLHLVDWARLPLFDRPTVDAALYVEMAKRIAASFVWPEVFYKPPLYPCVLGLAWKLAGPSWFLLRLPGVVCGAATCAVVWWLGRRVFGARIGLLAGLLWALHRTAVYFDGELLEIGLVGFLHTAALALVLRGGTETSTRRASVLAGVVLGLGTVARPTLILFDVAALVWLGRRRALPALAGLAVAVLPVTLHNLAHGHDFVLVSSNLGVNYYLGNNPQADGRIAAGEKLPANPAAAEQTARSLAEKDAGRPLRASQVSDYWLRQGLAWDATHPVAALGLLLRKFFYAWNGAEISDNEDLGGIARHGRVLRLLPVGTWLLAPLGLLGFLLAPRRRDTTLLRGFVACQLVGLLPFFIVARFRSTWMPVLAVFAAWAVFELVRRVAGRQPGRLRLLATAAATGLFCSLPAFGVRSPVDFDFDYKLGYAWQQKGDVDRALGCYRAAIDRNPQNALAYNAMGVLLGTRGQDLDAAVTAVDKAIELDPARTSHYAESLAGIELRRGHAIEALAAVQRGLAASPDPSTRGALLLRQAEVDHALGDVPSEITVLQAVLALGPVGAPADSARVRLRRMSAATAPPVRP